ncbi:MAG: Ig-like domain-containing protein [Pseudomonadota bacterium]
MLAIPLLSHAYHVGEVLAADQQAVSAGNAFLAALAQWEKLPPSLKEANLGQLVQLAQARRQLMLQLVQSDAKVAAARMLPQSIRARMPAQVAPYVEEEVKVQGTGFVNVADNFASGISHASFKILGQAGEAPQTVYLADPLGSERDLHRLAGKKLTFNAMRLGDFLVLLDKKKVQVQALQPAGGASIDAAAATTGTVVQGEQKTLSILLNFSDKALSCSAADVASRVFGSSGATVNTLFQDASRGLVGFSGTAIGPFNIPYTSTGSCNYGGWATAAEAAAKAAGVDPALYARVNYVTPSNATCGWSGMAYMPGRQSWVQACSATGVFAHELGHNLALHHAATPSAEYGDASDPMGAAKAVGLNGANRVMAGWQPSGTVLDVTNAGSYAVASVSDSSVVATPQVLRIAKPDTADYYYISLRQATGYDAALGSQYVNALSVHRATGILPTRTYLMQVLAAGQSFSDASNGITISNQGVSNGAAGVGVVLAAAVCTRAAPSISLSPASQTATAGTTLAYTITVQNNNTAACATASFNLGQVLPAGFTGALSATSLALAAGASGAVSWAVTPLSTVPGGTYGLDVTVTDAGAASSQASGHASYVVYSGDRTPPAISITSPGANASVAAGKALSIGAAASDTGGIQAVEFFVDGALLARDTSAPYTASWSTRKVVKGQHSIKARAIDNAGNVAEQTVAVMVH